MIKRLFNLGVLVGALALVSSGAKAVEFDTMPPNVNGGTGTWHITVLEQSHTGSANVLGGGTSTWSVNVHAKAGDLPNGIGHHVTITMWDSLGSPNASGMVGTTPGATTGSGNLTLNGAWVWAGPDSSILWNATNIGGIVDGIDNTNPASSFNALFTINEWITMGTVGANIADGVAGAPPAWGGQAPITPEASSLALILPGLIPLGVVLRRRRAARA